LTSGNQDSPFGGLQTNAKGLDKANPPNATGIVVAKDSELQDLEQKMGR